MNEKNVFKSEFDPEFMENLELASQRVQQMPDWQRGVLEYSMRASSPVPRPFVSTSSELSEEEVPK